MLRINKKILNFNERQISKIHNPNCLTLSLFCVLGLLFLLILGTNFVGNKYSIINTVLGDEINGTENADSITGTISQDIIKGLQGNDTIGGKEGGDDISGGDGDDAIYGNEGRDWLRGGSGNDHIEAGEGNDMLFGDRGDDGGAACERGRDHHQHQKRPPRDPPSRPAVDGISACPRGAAA